MKKHPYQAYADAICDMIRADRETTEAELSRLRELVGEMREALSEARRAIGDHYAPDDCYATGPLTGDAFRDLVQCPACSFIAMHETAIAKADAILKEQQ